MGPRKKKILAKVKNCSLGCKRLKSTFSSPKDPLSVPLDDVVAGAVGQLEEDFLPPEVDAEDRRRRRRTSWDVLGQDRQLG